MEMVDQKTLPMTVDAESWLRLTLTWSSNRLSAADTKDLEEFMRGYGHLCVHEALPHSRSAAR
jgi:hypothetical protein